MMEILNLLIKGALFSVFATALAKAPWNTNTYHLCISGNAPSAAPPLALLTNRYSNNHRPSILSGQQTNGSLVLLSPSVSTYTRGFMERRCFDTLKLLPHDQTSKYLPGQQRATPRQLTMQHLNISRMQNGWYTGEEMGGREKQRSKAWTGEIMSTGAHRRTSTAI